MPYGSGLSKSLGIATESVVGTQVTPNAWYEIININMQAPPTFLDSQGIKAGNTYKRSARTVISRFDVSGDVTMEFADKGTVAATGKGMGLWLKHMLGSTAVPVQIAATTAYRQDHVPATRAGVSFTMQAGWPQPNATVQPFTWRGCKIVGWEFSCNDGQIAQVKMTIDGWRETTATGLTAPVFAGASYQATPFSFADATTFTLGGTASTTAGRTTVASGVALTTLSTGITITSATPLAQERYGLGNAGTKAEQIENGIPTLTGHLDAEFTSRTEIYDLFAANTTTVMELDFTHGDAGSSNPYKLGFIFPAIKFKNAQITDNGADIVGLAVDFEAYDDGSGTNPPFQIELVSQDQAI